MKWLEKNAEMIFIVNGIFFLLHTFVYVFIINSMLSAAMGSIFALILFGIPLIISFIFAIMCFMKKHIVFPIVIAIGILFFNYSFRVYNIITHPFYSNIFVSIINICLILQLIFIILGTVLFIRKLMRKKLDIRKSENIDAK